MTGEKNNRLFPLIPKRTAAPLSQFNVSGYKLCHNGLHKLRENYTTGDNAQLKINLLVGDWWRTFSSFSHSALNESQ